MYEADQTGVAPLHQSPLRSIRWWPGPLVLAAETQMARIEFDGHRLEINGMAGMGGTAELQPGRTYLLMLNVAGADPDSGYPDILQQVPVGARLVGEADISYELLNGVLAIENRKPGAQMRDGYLVRVQSAPTLTLPHRPADGRFQPCSPVSFVVRVLQRRSCWTQCQPRTRLRTVYSASAGPCSSCNRPARPLCRLHPR